MTSPPKKLQIALLLLFAGACIIALAIDSIAIVWGERRPVGAFFEEFVAEILFWGGAVGSFGAGIWGGIKVYEKSGSKWLGWICGISLFVMIGVGTRMLSSKIPGVGWRIERMNDEWVDRE